jgi:hypothetical protein
MTMEHGVTKSQSQPPRINGYLGFGQVSFNQHQGGCLWVIFCCMCCRERKTLTITENPPRITLRGTPVSERVELPCSDVGCFFPFTCHGSLKSTYY